MKIDRRLIAHFDFVLLGLTLLIPCLGLIVLYSAGFDPEWDGVSSMFWPWTIQSQAFLRQFVWIGLGFVALLFGVSLSPNFLGRWVFPLYGCCIAMLVAVDLFGTIVNGSQRWLSFGGFNIQPAEPTKLAVILALARYVSKNPPKPGGYRFKEMMLPMLIFGIPMLLILKQPDLGTAMVVGSVGFSMVLFAGVRPKVLLAIILPAVIALYPAWHFLHDYQKKRILVLVDPDIDPRGSGYHITQSKIAVGSGEFLGKGFMKGTQTQLEFLPEHTTDFVFSVLAEEWGFLGCLTVISAYILFLGRMLTVVARTRELFMGMAAFGITTLIFVHSFVNMGMVIGILPVVGIPLPLFSYGGSSVLSCMFAVGIAMGLDMRRTLYVSRS